MSRIAVTVLAGLDRSVTALVSAGLLTRTEHCASIWVDPAPVAQGHVTCLVDDSDGRHEVRRVPLHDDCLSCTMRSAVVEALARLRAAGRYDTAVVELHPGIEVPAAVAGLRASLSPDVAVVDTVVAVLDPRTWLADLAGNQSLAQRGLAVNADDRRPLAAVLASQLDVADHLVFATDDGRAHRGDADTATAIAALAPTARRITPPTALDVPVAFALATGDHDPRCLHPMTDRGLLDWTGPPPLTADGNELSVMRWWRQGCPLHPARLFEALEQLGDGVIRSSGRLWFAHAPNAAVRWDSAGGTMHVGTPTPWAPHDHPNAAAPSGRPGNRLTFLGRRLDHHRIAATLTGCLLTAEELANGDTDWSAVSHPFPTWHVVETSESPWSGPDVPSSHQAPDGSR